ncbi:SAM-dependent MidA family methyltransferase [Streptomyces sp. Amel2xB2]|uniref:SAM-dependent methyltransferase n=1 Tax=Streptomyces sp. Amel2xB2 TaxID=1305829 RepID=UPI000DB98BC9|nr:SAM-dependent methyltransferase [Streptomyces sp. Amel2xB2]RAJ55465.1 SAM-dependent MidA family methyltransferase [Streptomyces sp. Amel2xB2]
MHTRDGRPHGTDGDGDNDRDEDGGGCWLPWRTAAERALYGDSSGNGDGRSGGGFFVREAPAAHFRTSVHASPLFALAVARLLLHVDEALGRPRELAMVDVGAGRGELLTGVLEALPAGAAARVRPYAVERAPRPDGLDERIVWSHSLPAGARPYGLDGSNGPSAQGSSAGGLTGLLFANEWLDDVPLDIAETDADGVPRTVLVRTSDGAERLGEPVTGPEAEWLERWWPLPPPEGHGAEPGLRAEIGLPRDEAWAAAVATLARGLAVAVDYAHFREDRPPFGTLTGYLDGREAPPVPDGSRDLTAHVALDACAAAGARAAADGCAPPVVRTQRDALHSLGIDGARPPLSLATSDPPAYVRQLAAAGEAAELTSASGLGAFRWLVQPVGGTRSPFG